MNPAEATAIVTIVVVAIRMDRFIVSPPRAFLARVSKKTQDGYQCLRIAAKLFVHYGLLT
jgi:hypothetical protein